MSAVTKWMLMLPESWPRSGSNDNLEWQWEQKQLIPNYVDPFKLDAVHSSHQKVQGFCWSRTCTCFNGNACYRTFKCSTSLKSCICQLAWRTKMDQWNLKRLSISLSDAVLAHQIGSSTSSGWTVELGGLSLDSLSHKQQTPEQETCGSHLIGLPMFSCSKSLPQALAPSQLVLRWHIATPGWGLM